MSLLSDMPDSYNLTMDLNLLRVFDAIYAARSISKAAERLGMSQPACSQALSRLRIELRDPLFERTAGGVKPTERADRLARSVQGGLALLDEGLREPDAFHPRTSRAELKLHLTDIGEMRFLPRLVQTLQSRAPGVKVLASPWPQKDITEALHNGDLHLAIGFLPQTQGTQRVELLKDRYALMVKAGHPLILGRTKAGISIRALSRSGGGDSESDCAGVRAARGVSPAGRRLAATGLHGVAALGTQT